MPLTARGEAIFDRLPSAAPRESTGSIGCEIVRHEELCIGCARCASACPTGATTTGGLFDPMQLFAAPSDSRRGALGEALRKIARHQPAAPIEVPAEGERSRRIFRTTQLLADSYEASIAAHPADWHMLQRLWQDDLDPARAAAAAPAASALDVAGL